MVQETLPSVSVVVISYNMARELKRTLYSLSTRMQVGINKSQYEIIVVDNGSLDTAYLEDCRSIESNIIVINMDNASQSPSAAVNKGIRHAKANIIGVMIDGARIASPGLLQNVLLASKLHHRPVVSTLGFHLGREQQMVSIKKGYNQDIEDKLLDDVDWTADGYRLFDISVFASSSNKGFFLPISESNALFMNRDMWLELGGFDQNFACPGGGLVNLDTYVRACTLQDAQLIILLGEGTFHQVHNGVATNSQTSPWEEFHKEYVRLRGKPFAQASIRPWYFGTLAPQVMPMIEQSARKAMNGGAKSSKFIRRSRNRPQHRACPAGSFPPDGFAKRCCDSVVRLLGLFGQKK